MDHHSRSNMLSDTKFQMKITRANVLRSRKYEYIYIHIYRLLSNIRGKHRTLAEEEEEEEEAKNVQ